MPSEAPCEAPSEVPSEAPCEAPSEVPSDVLSELPSEILSEAPSGESDGFHRRIVRIEMRRAEDLTAEPMHILKPSVLLLIACLLVAAGGSPAAAQGVLHRAHAHNDYEHARPLHDALDHGFGSVEVDVHLVDGDLLVAHDLEDVRPHETLESLYLDPLRRRIRGIGGSVYGDGASITLLVDVKSDAAPTYRVLRSVLRRYADILTIFAGDAAVEGAVTAVVSGNRSRDDMLAEPIRFAAYDGRLEDLEEHPDQPAAFVPLISAPWSAISAWRGDGPIPAEDLERLRAVVERSHAQERKLRFWATPDTPAVWDVLLEEGVDVIGADDLRALRDYLAAR